MSKAFKGEDASEAPLVVPGRAPLPPGTPNYVTPRGYAALRAELDELLRERARTEAAAEGEERTRALATLAVRLGALEERIASAQLVRPEAQAHEPRLRDVRFGATVTARTEAGDERRYVIVGVDEADAKQGRLAFVAPLAKALLGRRVGDVATVRTPRGDEEWEVVAITYDE